MAVIVDVKCTRKECAEIRVDVLMKSSNPHPACLKCGAPTERQWSVSLGGTDRSCNHGSLTVRSNFMVED